jgi:hypothetical protein
VEKLGDELLGTLVMAEQVSAIIYFPLSERVAITYFSWPLTSGPRQPRRSSTALADTVAASLAPDTSPDATRLLVAYSSIGRGSAGRLGDPSGILPSSCAAADAVRQRADTLL